MAVLLVLASGLSLAQAQDHPEGGNRTLDPRDPHPFGEAGTGYWSFRLGYYDKQDNGQGNPFVDESVTVIEPVIVYDYQASEDFGYNVQFNYDHVSSASIKRLSVYDAQSGASGDNYLGVDASFRHKLTDSTKFNWHAGISTEYDYTSLGLGAGVSHTLDPQDAVLSANLNAYVDSVKLIRYNGVDQGTDTRTSLAGTLSWYQVLGPNTHGELGVTLSAQSGYLESPINSVVIEDPLLPPNPYLANNARGTEISEELPNSRLRTAIYGTVRHALDDRNAVELGGRLYHDDWGIQAYDLTPKFIHQFDSGMLVDLRVRYYDQTAADAYQASFTDPLNIPVERTQDSELGKFDSTLFGTHVRWSDDAAWDFGLDYLSRSDGLDHVFFSVGWKQSF